MKKICITLLILAGFGVGSWLINSGGPGTVPASPQHMVKPSPAPETSATSIASVTPVTARSARTASGAKGPPGQRPQVAPVSEAARNAAASAVVAAALEDLKTQYAYAGALGWGEAKALIARRKQATLALEDQLADLGPGGATLIGASYVQAEDMRGKLLLIHALGRINDDQAGAVLQTLLAGENAYSLQREMVVALGHRTDAASTEVLKGLLVILADPQLRFAAAQALRGREAALSLLAERIRVEPSPDVQKELVLSLGAIGNATANRFLRDIAQSTVVPDVRQAALRELRRMGISP